MPSPPREIRIAACAPASFGYVQEKDETATVRMIKGLETDPSSIRAHVDRLLDHQLRNLEKAARHAPALAVIPEDCLRLAMLICRHGGQAWCERAIDEARERYLERIGQFCRQNACYVAGGTLTCRRGRYYNTALLQDPEGKVIASYDKTHLPRTPENSESDFLTPGDELPVFDTPLGKIGFLICWDILFPETFEVLALKGAELIIHPTFGHEGEWSDTLVRCRCRDWSVPLAVSMWGRNACIVDAEGHFAAHTGNVPDAVAAAALTLGAPRRFLHLSDAARQLREERRPLLYGAVTENHARLPHEI
jgi:predicted amidohydrolase